MGVSSSIRVLFESRDARMREQSQFMVLECGQDVLFIVRHGTQAIGTALSGDQVAALVQTLREAGFEYPKQA